MRVDSLYFTPFIYSLQILNFYNSPSYLFIPLPPFLTSHPSYYQPHTINLILSTSCNLYTKQKQHALHYILIYLTFMLNTTSTPLSLHISLSLSLLIITFIFITLHNYFYHNYLPYSLYNNSSSSHCNHIIKRQLTRLHITTHKYNTPKYTTHKYNTHDYDTKKITIHSTSVHINTIYHFPSLTIIFQQNFTSSHFSTFTFILHILGDHHFIYSSGHYNINFHTD